VSGAERVADKIVRQIRELFRECIARLLRLRLLFSSETGVLEKNDVSVLHRLNRLRRLLAGDVVIRDKGDFLSELFGEAFRDRCKGLTLVRAVL
jgi:hypothetical protein